MESLAGLVELRKINSAIAIPIAVQMAQLITDIPETWLADPKPPPQSDDDGEMTAHLTTTGGHADLV